MYHLYNSHTDDWSQSPPPVLLSLTAVLCLAVCRCLCLRPCCLCVTVPLSPRPCNCLGLGWRSRPDRRTQIPSGDRLKRSVCSPLYLSSSITRVWQRQRCMMDGCPAPSPSTSHSVHSDSLSLTHFFLHSVSLHPPITCYLCLFIICLYVFLCVSVGFFSLFFALSLHSLIAW